MEKKKLSKKAKITIIGIAALCAVLIIGITVSGRDEYEQTFNSYVKSVESGDYKSAMKLMAENADDTMDITKQSAQYESFATYGDTMKTDLLNAYRYVLSTTIKDVKVTNKKKSVSGKTTTETITATCRAKDYDSVQLLSSSDTASLVERMEKKHMSELKKVYVSKGYSAMMKKLYSYIAPEIRDQVIASAKKIEYVSAKIIVKVTNNAGKYKIASIRIYKS